MMIILHTCMTLQELNRTVFFRVRMIKRERELQICGVCLFH